MMCYLNFNMQDNIRRKRGPPIHMNQFIPTTGIIINEPNPQAQCRRKDTDNYQGKGKAPMIPQKVRGKKKNERGMGLFYNDVTGGFTWNVSNAIEIGENVYL